MRILILIIKKFPQWATSPTTKLIDSKFGRHHSPRGKNMPLNSHRANSNHRQSPLTKYWMTYIAKLRSIILVLVLAPALIINSLPANAYEGQEHYQAFLVAYSELLERHLIPNSKKEGILLTSVNYGGWAIDHRHSKAMHNLRQIRDPAVMPPVTQMAFWINVYNFLTVDLIIKKHEEKSIRNHDGIFRNVWQRNYWKLFGDSYTLDRIEHKILRPMDEPRIHYAINCASLSCPDLLDKPYTENGLFAQLEKQEADFINNPTKGVYIEFAATGEVKKVKISKIFSWYQSDFGRKKEIKQMIEGYKNIKMPHKQGFIEYNWKLNGDW